MFPLNERTALTRNLKASLDYYARILKLYDDDDEFLRILYRYLLNLLGTSKLRSMIYEWIMFLDKEERKVEEIVAEDKESLKDFNDIVS